MKESIATTEIYLRLLSQMTFFTLMMEK